MTSMTGDGAMWRSVGAGTFLALVMLLSPMLAWAQAGPRVFATPEAATAALVDAVASGDHQALQSVVGSAFADLIDAQGSEAGEADRERFLEAAKRATVLRPDGADRRIVEVGLEAWPLPAPLVRVDGGWRFDGDAGIEAMQDRLVGRNELEAIRVLRAYVEAQVDYAAEIRDDSGVRKYAQRLASTPGRHDGLYWPVTDDEKPSPFGPFLAAAGVHPESREAATPYYGYLYRIMTRQGPNAAGGAYDYIINGNMIAGFALVAWPAVYGATGIMTFLVNQSGVVLEKDMGPRTDAIGPRMRTYNPDAGWRPVGD